jgi:hypothetical protein
MSSITDKTVKFMFIGGTTAILVGSIPPLIGFTTKGIAAFSKASLIHSGIGSVVKGSGFALGQSIAAQGIFSTIAVSGAVIATSAASIYGVLKLYKHIYP